MSMPDMLPTETRTLGCDRTFFEVRQILRTLYQGGLHCPDGVAFTLRELDGHAHRPGDR